MARAARQGSTEPVDAIALLKADHRTVEELFEKFESARGAGAKERIARRICTELCVHAMIEEEIFYPAIKDVVEEDIYAEAHVEHDGAKVLIAEILSSTPDDPFYEARVKVLAEEIRHHVREEEQRGGMFSQAKKGDVDLDQLGDLLAQRKAELVKTIKRDGLPPLETRSMKGVKLKIGQPVAPAA
jgi:hemerythrin superfamily protein